MKKIIAMMVVCIMFIGCGYENIVPNLEKEGYEVLVYDWQYDLCIVEREGSLYYLKINTTNSKRNTYTKIIKIK